MFLKIIFKNIKNSLTGYTKAYVLLIVSQLVAVIMLLFSYGVFGSFSEKKEELDIESYLLVAQFTGEATVKELKECLNPILERFEKKLDYFAIRATQDRKRIFSYHEYIDGEYYLAQSLYTQSNYADLQGRFISHEELNDGSKVMIIGGTGVVGDYYTVEGEKFEIVGVYNDIHTSGGTVYIHIPINVFPEDIPLDFFGVLFDKNLPTLKEYEFFRQTLKSQFGDGVIIEEFKLRDEEEIIRFNTIIIMSVIIGVVTALNTALIYCYILNKRRHQMAVFGIVGANSLQRILINEAEIVIVNIFTILTGFVLFKIVLEKGIIYVYNNSEALYHIKSYALLLGIYFVIVLIITCIVTLCNTGKKFLYMRRGGVV